MKGALAAMDETVVEGEQESMASVEAGLESGDTPTELAEGGIAPVAEETSAEVPDADGDSAPAEEVDKAVAASQKRRVQEPRAPRRAPNPRYLMLEMPKEKRTNSRAGIKRTVKLSSRMSQEMYFRTYAKVSDGNFFMERIYPGMVLTRKGSSTEVVKVGFDALTEFWKKLYEDYEGALSAVVASVKERLESEGVDPEGIQLDYSEALEEEALVTSRTDQRVLSLLEGVDEAVGYLSVAGLYDVYTPEEVARLEREVRQGFVNVYRNVVRSSFESSLLMKTGKTSDMRRAEREAKEAGQKEG